MQTSNKKISQKQKNTLLTQLSTVLADFSHPAEVELFLQDFFTDTEINVFTKRLGIIYRLHIGESYEKIKDELKVSSATIASMSELVNKTGIQAGIKKITIDQWAATIFKKFSL